jgi:hypothetical protein
MTPLTGKSILEEEMRKAILEVPLIIQPGSARDDYEGYAKACAEVAKRYIEKAFRESSIYRHGSKFSHPEGIDLTQESFEIWAKGNGIIGASLFPNKEEQVKE